MAQWSRSDRTLYAKVVYYGPAYGGKTTNLQSLHRITDPQSRNQLLSLQTADDRTLFFDLLPFDLGDILGYQVALKLYTVPGQVRYETTRQVVLAGADAVIFVADSRRSRQDQNVWSLQNLRMNMRAKGLDPDKTPVLFQFNKQDLAESAPPKEVASWLRLPSARAGIAAVASEGRGVLESFRGACTAMLKGLVERASERTRSEIDPRQLEDHLERAFSPHAGRKPAAEAPARETVVLNTDDLLASAVHSGVELGEKLAAATSRAKRLEREADALRALGEAIRGVGATLDGQRLSTAVLAAVARILDVPVVSLIGREASGAPVAEQVRGRQADPLLECAPGRAAMARLVDSGRSRILASLADECGAEASIAGLRCAAAAPVSSGRALVAYAPEPDGSFDDHDARFLATVAAHLGIGLDQVRLHDELSGHRQRLELRVAERTAQLKRAYDELRAAERSKHRFLGNLSHEMRTPLTAVLSASQALRDYQCGAAERREMAADIVASAELLERQIDGLFRLVELQDDGSEAELEDVRAEQVVDEALSLVGRTDVERNSTAGAGILRAEPASLARALANLIDNAFKFSPPGSAVSVHVAPGRLDTSEGAVEALCLSVLDRGAGVPPEDRDRVFIAFEQGGDELTGKPQGLGLGLHETRTVVRRHHGTVACHERPGGGSEFRITIPVQPVARPRPEAVRA